MAARFVDSTVPEDRRLILRPQSRLAWGGACGSGGSGGRAGGRGCAALVAVGKAGDASLHLHNMLPGCPCLRRQINASLEFWPKNKRLARVLA